MSELAWNWLCLPYLVCALSLAAVGMAAALIRGDRVLRLGTIGAATTALPWALCSGLVTCTSDSGLATRLVRLGNGPIALVGPSLLLVLLGVSGQLERNRWIARVAGLLGLAFMVMCWSTDWIVGGVHPLSSGILYTSPGPLTGAHFGFIAVWLGFGIHVVRRSTSGGERKRLARMLLGVLALATIGASDLLLVYDLAGTFPLAWLCATIAAVMSLYFELRTDLLRPQGFDRNVLVETLAFAVAMVIVAIGALVSDIRSPVLLAAGASLVWVSVLGVAWGLRSTQPVRIARERALEQFVATIGDVDIEGKIAERLAALWEPVGIEVRRTWRLEGDELVEIASGNRRPIDPQVAAWLVEHNEALASVDLGTMRLGELRPRLEALVATHRATVIVPLIDRGSLVGLLDADHREALREDERGLVAESARAAARALTYLGLARTAARERETAREVEV
ncbi:MAG: hypothetical protein KIT31_33665, partial [Deltaproteobacteria bacterium]|nr:hypothetical protein [Deltaproteobacteria bacterium]